MRTFTVDFLPQDHRVHVEEGTSLLEAALIANISMNNLCGGDGICGRCKMIVREGDPGEALYLIRKGCVEVFTLEQNKRVKLSELGPGACFGEVALLSGRPRTANVMAKEDCTILCLYKGAIDEILNSYPKVRKLLEALVRGRAENTIGILTRIPDPQGD